MVCSELLAGQTMQLEVGRHGSLLTALVDFVQAGGRKQLLAGRTMPVQQWPALVTPALQPTGHLPETAHQLSATLIFTDC